MCYVQAIYLGVAALMAYDSHEQGVDNAERQGEALAKEHDLKQSDLRRQQQQQYDAQAAEQNAAARQAARDAALFDVVAGEYGGGNSVDRARAVSQINVDETIATIGRNGSTAREETLFRSIATQKSSLSQIGTLKGPSRLGTALKLGAAAGDYYGKTK